MKHTPAPAVLRTIDALKAFDTIFAEGQRRFLETLTPYARQFLPTMPRPDVDSVSGEEMEK